MAAQRSDSTVPLDDRYTETVTYHGREYQRYSIENNVYFSPIDEDEIERQSIAHEAFRSIFDDRLIFPPVRRLRKLLDCGFGSGSWACEVAQQHPECEVLGIDVSPHLAPEDELPNLDLQVDDLNRRFTFETGEFDFVHSQMVAGGIDSARWRSYMRDIFRVLRPGGWCQLAEIYFQAQSDNGSLTDDHALRHWSRLYLQAIGQYKDPRAPTRLDSLLRSAGFTEIEVNVIQVPMCGWPADARMKQAGCINRENVQRTLSSQAMYLFTEKLRMPYDQAQVLIAQARLEADNPAFKAYFPLYVCIGRKPSRPR
ncbi:umta methyltransferase [Ophiostoma piceae UAMH 11346]|uniref:Umta methyltransferase n=1 Tax=Ophiostoma piceae (strain UAMH 11346) TaxID=1262450 RepID=S3CCP6_OPHP1|nr:umta methyltransferase [Ophiostoma piceae UAMH 11346]